VVLEGAGRSGDAGKDDGGFDADVAIATGELSQLIPDLIEALAARTGQAPTCPAPAWAQRRQPQARPPRRMTAWPHGTRCLPECLPGCRP